MRVLVTGGSGFVGKHLLSHLSNNRHEVISWSLGADAVAVGTAVDLRDPSAVPDSELRRLDAVIHLAGLAQVSASFERPAEYIGTNAAMQSNLMEAMLRVGSSARILVVSTGGVYDASSDVLTEQSPTAPANPYVISKLTQELLAAYYSRRGLDVLIARPFNHIGPGQQRGYLVADLAAQIAALERAGGGEVEVGRLESARDYSDVRDVVSAYLHIILDGGSGETYNVCSGYSHTGAEIFEQLAAMSTVPVRTVRRDSLDRPTDTDQVRASSEKLSRETGWQPTIALEQTLADTLAYWREQIAG